MNLQPIFPPTPACTLTCLRCGKPFPSNMPGARADLDGAPFAAYHCGPCGKAESEHTREAALAVALSAIENLDFNAWERCGHDSAAYRRLTGAPSLAEAAGAIRAVLRPAS